MCYFFTLLAARLRSLLRSPALLVTTLVFVAITVAFGAVLPRSQPLPMGVGLLAESEAGQQAAALLSLNTDYDFIAYTTAQELERDVMGGVVHCGYRLGEGKRPVIALATRNAYMRPLVDELVLAAWNQAQAPAMTQQFLDENQLAGDAREQMAALAATTRPMTVELQTVGQSADTAAAASTAQPLLYAVMITAFLAAAVVSATLLGNREQRGLRQLAVFSGRPVATHTAGVLAWTLVQLAALLAADSLVSLLLGDSAYPLARRLPVLALLGLSTLVFALGGSLLRRYAGVVAMLLPPALLVGVLCSGALVSPQLLPGGLGLLRYLSPAWYLLPLLNG